MMNANNRGGTQDLVGPTMKMRFFTTETHGFGFRFGIQAPGKILKRHREAPEP